MCFQDNLQTDIELLEQIEKQLQSTLQNTTLEQYLQNINDHNKKASIPLNLAYQISSLYFSKQNFIISPKVYLKLNGIDTKNAPIMKEIDRVRQNYERTERIKRKSEGLPEAKPQKKVNLEVAQRFIKHDTNNRLTEQEEMIYQKKQASLIEQEEDFSQRLETHEKMAEKKLLDPWKDGQQQKLIKGSLMPRQGHLNWKKEIEKIMK